MATGAAAAGSLGLGKLIGIAAIGTALNGVLNAVTGKASYDQSIEMWRRNNEYNTPAAQMERLKEAGLNPNLVYGSGSVVGNTSHQPTAPGYQAPHFDLELQNLLLDNQLRQQSENIKAKRIQNKVNALRFDAMYDQVQLTKKLGMPAGTPWYALYLMDFVQKNRSSIENNSDLRGVGSLMYDLFGKFISAASPAKYNTISFSDGDDWIDLTGKGQINRYPLE